MYKKQPNTRRKKKKNYFKIVSMLKNFAALMPLYLTFQTAKVKIKLLLYFFPNSDGSYTVPEIWQVTHVIVTFHFGLFFALPPSPL